MAQREPAIVDRALGAFDECIEEACDVIVVVIWRSSRWITTALVATTNGLMG